MVSPILTGLGFLAELCHLLSVSFSSLWLSISVIKVMRILAREGFFHVALGGEVPATPATMSVTSRGTHFEFPFYVFMFKESWDSDSLKTEAAHAFLLSTLLWPVQLICFPGCMRKWYDIV